MTPVGMRPDASETIVRRAIVRLSTTGVQSVRTALLEPDERQALGDLNDSQMYRLDIGQCERCGEREFFLAGEMAEMYDTNNLDTPSQLIHANCTPEGWDVA